jgi:hypothetical protein
MVFRMQGTVIARRSPYNTANFRYLVMMLTNQNCVHESIKKRLISGNTCCHSANNLLSFVSVYDCKIKTCETTILPVVRGCEIWSLVVKEGTRLRVFDSKVQREITVPQRRSDRRLSKITLRRASRFVLLTKDYSGDHIKEDEMGRECGTYGREQKLLQGFPVELERKRPL